MGRTTIFAPIACAVLGMLALVAAGLCAAQVLEIGSDGAVTTYSEPSVYSSKGVRSLGATALDGANGRRWRELRRDRQRLAGAGVPATTEGGFNYGDATGEDPGKSDSDADSSLTAEAGGVQPALLGIAPVDTREIVSDPVSAGTGSEEIWRKHWAKQ